MGDAIEAAALLETYGKDSSSFPCYLGAIKTNIGHLESAAGIAGLIKALLCMKNRKIPKNLHFQQLNPNISMEHSRLTIPKAPIKWDVSSEPLYCGISSFGFTGTNAHIILESHDTVDNQKDDFHPQKKPKDTHSLHQEQKEHSHSISANEPSKENISPEILYFFDAINKILDNKINHIDINFSLIELALDSLMITTLKHQLEKQFQTHIPVHMFNPTIPIHLLFNSITPYLLKKQTISLQPKFIPETDQYSNHYVKQLLDRASKEIPQELVSVDQQNQRELVIQQKKIIDFASCNYLGLDLHPDVISAIPGALKQWGTHPSWTPAVAYPKIYEQLEYAIARWIGAPDVLVFPSITLLHTGIIPVLARGEGIIFQDIFAHYTASMGCRLAEADGATSIQYGHNDLDDLEKKLSSYSYDQTKIIIIDGVFSMSGTYPPLKEYTRLSKKYNALLYIDDAHGIGILGENPDRQMPYGYKGNGIVRHTGLDYVDDNIIYIAGLSKAFSSYGAFVSCHDSRMKKQFQLYAGTYGYSGPSPIASLASALKGIDINNREGDGFRRHIYALTQLLVEGAQSLGFTVQNSSFFPIVSIMIGHIEPLIKACQILWKHNILITPAYYPVVPFNASALRFSITAANTKDQIEQALEGLYEISTHLKNG